MALDDAIAYRGYRYDPAAEAQRAAAALRMSRFASKLEAFTAAQQYRAADAQSRGVTALGDAETRHGSLAALSAPDVPLAS